MTGRHKLHDLTAGTAVVLLTCVGINVTFAHPTYEDAVLGHYRLVDELDRNQYADNVSVRHHYFAGGIFPRKILM